VIRGIVGQVLTCFEERGAFLAYITLRTIDEEVVHDMFGDRVVQLDYPCWWQQFAMYPSLIVVIDAVDMLEFLEDVTETVRKRFRQARRDLVLFVKDDTSLSTEALLELLLPGVELPPPPEEIFGEE
jgi:hypothetical protein